jgi:hypothetical protein
MSAKALACFDTSIDSDLVDNSELPSIMVVASPNLVVAVAKEVVTIDN